MHGPWRPSLDDYVEIATVVLATDGATIRALPRLTLAESAIHAPFASFGGVVAYPSLIEQAAVLIDHLANNHPLPDGNKRAAFLMTARFLDANGLVWGEPDMDTDAGVIERIAAGATTQDEVTRWIELRTTQS